MDILIFDVNETLLDLRALDPAFTDVFGDAASRREWFAMLLERAFSATLTGVYRDFGVLARSALRMLAAKRGVLINDQKVEDLLKPLRQLPAHPEAAGALQLLAEAGFQLAALTQSPLNTLEAQLSNAGLKQYFHRLFSADEVKRYKPDPATYRMVASAFGCETGAMRLVAAHAWDIEGALRAGCKAAFVARPGQVLDPLVDAPDIVGADLDEVAMEILGRAGAIKV